MVTEVSKRIEQGSFAKEQYGKIPESSSEKTVDTITDENNEFLSLDSFYQFVKILGHGSSAEVHLVENHVTGARFACKVVEKNNSINDEKSMSTEVEIMKRVQHRNVTGMHDCFDTKDRKQMVLDLASEGCLLDLLAKDPLLNEEKVAGYFSQILEGLSYLHSIGVVHRDLKLENILCSHDVKNKESVTMKLADFGLSALIPLEKNGYNPTNRQAMKKFKSLKEEWGTENYFAPEMRKRAYGPQADVWALGCLLFEILTGDVAFSAFEQKKKVSFFSKIQGFGKKSKKSFELNPKFQQLSPQAQDLIKGMLRKNPVDRFDPQECLEHPWLSKNQSEMNKSIRAKHLDEAYRLNRKRAMRKDEIHIDYMKAQ